MWSNIPGILRNSIIITFVFMVAFSLLEYSRTPDVVTVFQQIFKQKYIKTYLITFASALILQILIFPLIKLLF